MILYFSGTGNTRYAAETLGRLLAEPVIAMDVASASPRLAMEGNMVVWCFPTYSWGIPPVVVRYMRSVAFDGDNGAPHYMMTTCGDDMGQTDRQWQRIIAARGWDARSAFALVMPNTYVLMKGFNVDSPEVAQRKLGAAPERIAAIAEAIRSGAPSMLVPGRFAWIKSRIIYPWFCRHCMSAKPFGATAGCTGCGLCSRSCPMNNITMEKGLPHWGADCAMCLRCYHICPRRAVAYGTATEGKGQYRNPMK